MGQVGSGGGRTGSEGGDHRLEGERSPAELTPERGRGGGQWRHGQENSAARTRPRERSINNKPSVSNKPHRGGSSPASPAPLQSERGPGL